MRVIPTFNTPFYTVTTQLDGSVYQFVWHWNHRVNCWYFDLFDGNANAVRIGVKVVLGAKLLGPGKYVDNAPPGEILCITKTLDDSPPGINDLLQGTGRCKLLYLSVLDLVQLSQATEPSPALGDGG